MKSPSLNDFDMDEKLVNAINSKYYDISELCNVYSSKSSFSLFHSNLRSLSKHIEELQILLRSAKIPFDIIGVSETKEQVDKGFLTNVNLYGYDFYSQPSNASAGGVAIYIKSSLNYVIRDDLNRTEDEFECIWVEIKNSKCQNILCCCAYRHPNSETQKFLDYIESTLSMAKKEKKLLFIMGDFNFNLLNYESHTETNDFLILWFLMICFHIYYNPLEGDWPLILLLLIIYFQITQNITHSVAVSSVEFLTTFLNFWSWLRWTLTIRGVPLQREISQIWMNRNLFLIFLI